MKKKIGFVILVFFMFFGILLESQKENAQAAPKGHLLIKGSKKKLKSKSTVTVYVGGKSLKFSYSINGKNKGIKGTWSSTKKSVVSISKKGTAKALENGTATIRYTFKQGKKTYRLSCKVKVKTKAESVELRDVISESSDVSIGINADRMFETLLHPSEEALEVNSEIEPSSYEISYAVFGNKECTQGTELGEVSQDGRVRSYGYGGTMYLRAEARESATSKSVIYSNVATITIQGLTKEEKIKEEERLRQEAEEKAKKDRLRPARIEIMTQAPLDSSNPNLSLLPKGQISQVKANVGFKIFDGNGQDITFATGTAIGAISGRFRWNEQDVPVLIQTTGKAQLLLNNADKTQIINNKLITTPVQILYSRGSLTLTYSQAGYPDITATTEVTIVPQAIIHRVEIKGIYKMDLEKRNYVPVLEGNTVTIKKGDVITSSGGYTFSNEIPGSYYLLLKATDIYNNNTVGDGIKAADIGLVLTGETGIELDNIVGLGDNTAVAQSTKPVTIDGIPYLTFALKPATVKEGELLINLKGMQPYKKIISDGSSMLYFFLTSSVKNSKGTGMALVGQENILDYQLITTTGVSERNYEKVLSFLKVVNIGNATTVQLLPGSNVISGNKYGIFKIRKDGNGNAEIVYTPQMGALKYTNIPQMPFSPGEEEVTVLKGWGEKFEKMITIPVNKE